MTTGKRVEALLDLVLSALANPHRRAMVYLVGLQPWAVSRLAAHRGLSLPAVHKHVRILEEAGLVTRRKVGRTNYLTVNRRSMIALQSWISGFHPYWGPDSATYENYTAHPDRNGVQRG